MDEITIADLKDQFGEQILARGLSYMESLEEADQNYRESANGQYTDGLRRHGVEIDEDTEEKADSAWTDGMNEKGIGLEEGD